MIVILHPKKLVRLMTDRLQIVVGALELEQPRLALLAVDDVERLLGELRECVAQDRQFMC